MSSGADARPKTPAFDLAALLPVAAALARQHGVEVRVAASGAVVIKPVALGENGQPVDKRAERNRRYYEARRLKGAGREEEGREGQEGPEGQDEEEAQRLEGLNRLDRLNRLKTSESVLNRLNAEGEQAAPLPLSPSLPLSPQTPLSPAHPHTPTPGYMRVREEEAGAEAEAGVKAQTPPLNAHANAQAHANVFTAEADAEASPSPAPDPGTGGGRDRGQGKDPDSPPKAQVWAPDAAQKVVNGWFSRRDTTAWSRQEQKAWKAIPAEAKADGLTALAAAYTAKAGEALRYRRRDLLTLLNHWQGEIDRWRHFKAPVQSDVRPLQTGYEDPPFLTDDAAVWRPAASSSAAARAATSATTAAAALTAPAAVVRAPFTIQR